MLGDRAGHVARRLRWSDSEFELVLAGRLFRTESRIMRSALEATVKRSARFAYPGPLEAPAGRGRGPAGAGRLGAPADQERTRRSRWRRSSD